MYRYKAKVVRDGSIVEEIIETTEDLNRLLMHAHIHSAEPIGAVEAVKEVEVKEEKDVKKK